MKIKYKKNIKVPSLLLQNINFMDENSNWWTWKKLLEKSYSLKCYLTQDDLFPEFILIASLSFSGSLPAAFREIFKWELKLGIN